MTGMVASTTSHLPRLRTGGLSNGSGLRGGHVSFVTVTQAGSALPERRRRESHISPRSGGVAHKHHFDLPVWSGKPSPSGQPQHRDGAPRRTGAPCPCTGPAGRRNVRRGSFFDMRSIPSRSLIPLPGPGPSLRLRVHEARKATQPVIPQRIIPRS